MSPGSEGPGLWGACVFTVPRVRTMAPCPSFPSQSWSPGLPEKGNMGNHLCLSFSHQSHDGEEDADPCEPNLPGLRAQAEAPEPWAGLGIGECCLPQSARLLLPDLLCLPLAPLVLCSLATVFILEGPQKWGGLFSPSLGAWSACACLSPDTGAWLRACPWLLLCCQFINSK